MTTLPAPSTSPDASPEIRLTALTKRFQDVVAVDAISLTIESGEFFSLLGPSGCGKTTTLRMIGGFEQPTAGIVELRGHDVTTDPPDKRPINMVFQNYALFPHLDVGENVAFGLKRKHVAKDEIARRTGEVLELVHLAGYERRKPNQLSGGQQQRVALARALVNRPNVLLLDEPLGALDLKLRKALQVELKRIQQEVGITFVYVTHDQEEALTMSDRIAVMNRGRVEQLGSPEELYDRPDDSFRGRLHRHHEPAPRDRRVARGRLRPGAPGFRRPLPHRPTGARERPGGRHQRPPRGHRHPWLIAAPTERTTRCRLPSSSPHYLGSAVQYIVRTTGGVALTVLTAKNAERLTAEQAVVLDWPPDEALVLGIDRSSWRRRDDEEGRASPGPGGDSMTHPYDGSSIDLERELVRYLAERKVTRRELLQRIAAVGATAAPGAGHRRLHGQRGEHQSIGRSPVSGQRHDGAVVGPDRVGRRPTPVPSPESDLLIYNYADYLDPTIVTDFEKKYGTEGRHHLLRFCTTSCSRRVQAGNTGFDMTFPTDTDIPGLVEQGMILPLDLSLIPNVVNLAAEWADVKYDPGHKHSMPYMWWTTGFAYDTDKIKEDLTSWASLWDPRFNDHIMVLDDQREAFAAALIRQGKDINTVDDAELDAALALLKEQRPLVRTLQRRPHRRLQVEGHLGRP